MLMVEPLHTPQGRRARCSLDQSQKVTGRRDFRPLTRSRIAPLLRTTEVNEPLSSLNPLSGISPSSASLISPLHNSDLLFGQSIQLVHQRVDLGVGSLDLALVQFLVGGDGGGG